MRNKNIIAVSPTGTLTFENKVYKCALGKSGVRTNKREGDGATPAGTFPIREIFYRPDRLARPKTGLVLSPLKPNDAWNDDPDHTYYNRKVLLPHRGRVEPLWRKDGVYDIIVVIGYNDKPVKKSKGSAIFLHVAKDGFKHTEGCIALKLGDLLEIITSVTPPSHITVLSPQTD